MARAKTHGSGWHKESLRHRQAAKYGKAQFGALTGMTKDTQPKKYGDMQVTSINKKATKMQYESPRIKELVKEHPEYKNKTFKQLQKKGIYLKYQGDADKDGVKNINDCRPLNTKAQDNGEPADPITINNEEPKKQTFKENLKERYNRVKKSYETYQTENRKKHLSEINSGLRTKVENEEEIDVKTLSEHELEKLAIIEGEPFFGSNKYETELKRRIDAEGHLRTDLTIEREKNKKEEKQRLTDLRSNKGFFD